MAKAQIFTKPTNRKEAENPEIIISGYGRMQLSQLKDKIQRNHKTAEKMLKFDNYEGYTAAIKLVLDFVEAVEHVEKEMNSPKYKRLKTKLSEEPANAVGGGHIAGLGVGPQGEPGVTPSQQKRYKKNQSKFAKFIRR